MNRAAYNYIFCKAAGLLETDEDDTIHIGNLLPTYCPDGLEKVMEYHCKVIDDLISLSKSTLQTVELLALRGFTYHEYLTVLSDLTIKRDFHKYPALRCLFLSEKERRQVILALTRDWNGYQTLLAQVLTRFHSSISEFLFSDED